jgi:RNA 2',3'-cyclic 3'-phosphodiesterase
VRLFIAINLPDNEIRRLSDALAGLASYDLAVRWVDADSLHITLKFLGEVAEARLPALRAALAEALEGAARFDVALGNLGAFPSLARPNIFWLGVAPTPELLVLQQRTDDAMGALGFEREQRAFRPHITIGRARKDGRATDRKLMDRMVAGFDYKGVFRAESVDIMRSKLSPRGARYEVLERMELF